MKKKKETEGEGWPGPFYHMNDDLGRQKRVRGPPLKEQAWGFFLVISAPSAGVSNVCKARNIPLLVQKDELVCEMRSLNGGALPQSVYLGRHWHRLQNEMDQAFPFCFCIYCKWSKTGWWEGLGMRLKPTQATTTLSLKKFYVPASVYLLDQTLYYAL